MIESAAYKKFFDFSSDPLETDSSLHPSKRVISFYSYHIPCFNYRNSQINVEKRKKKKHENWGVKYANIVCNMVDK